MPNSPTTEKRLDRITFLQSWCQTDARKTVNCHPTSRWDWWLDCAVQSDAERAIGPPAADSLELFAHQSCRELLSFLFRSRNLHLPPLKYTCLQSPHSFLSWCWAADTFWFLSEMGQPALNHQNLFSSLDFSSMYSMVLGVHHPVHSQLPQWGHFFRNTLQANIALGITKSHMVILDLLLQGNSVLSQLSELFIWDQHWLKWLFTVPMICTLQPQNDCIWSLYLYFMVGKD